MSSYKNQLDSILKSINSASFDYDPDSDQAYQDFLERLKVQGAAAASDTIAQIADSTGGITSSYGAAAATSVANEYAQKGAEALLDFQKNARNNYDNDIDFLMDYAALLKSLEKTSSSSSSSSRSSSNTSSGEQVMAGPELKRETAFNDAMEKYNQVYDSYMKQSSSSGKSVSELASAAHVKAMTAYRQVLLDSNIELENGGGSFGLYSTYYED